MGLMDLFKKKSSGDVAKDRLKLLLVSDRANCSPEMMEMIKRDIIQVISKYMDIDADALDVKITETESDADNGMVPALYANIPIKDMKHKPDKRQEAAQLFGKVNTDERNKDGSFSFPDGERMTRPYFFQKTD